MNNYCKHILLTLMCLLSFTSHLYAQNDRQYIRSGNQLFRQQDYPKAEVEYRKALAANAQNTQALYNLGCALMMQQKDSAAIVQFQNAGEAERSKNRKAQVFHNIGWICQKHQMFADAIEAYKESLRNNPHDNETRYNLALCQHQLKNQQKNGGSNDKKDDQKGNDKDKKQSKDEQDKQQNNQKDKQQQQPKEQMRKENAEQLLNAAMQQERATQQRMKKAMQQPPSRKVQRNW